MNRVTSPVSNKAIAIAGGIAAGKSTFCKALTSRLKGRGVPVRALCYDNYRRAILDGQKSNAFTKLSMGLRRKFGAEVFDASGRVHRLRLNEIIFSDPQALKLFNDLIDPLIVSEMKQAESRSDTLFLVEWPCILERKLTEICDGNVILLQCSEQVQLGRLSHSDLSPTEIKNRIAFQGSCAARVQLFTSLKPDANKLRYSFISDEELPEALYAEVVELLDRKFRLREVL
jgi:dephospho-CoA kinase